MPRGDFRRRETKKTKKVTRKPSPTIESLASATEPELVTRRRVARKDSDEDDR